MEAKIIKEQEREIGFWNLEVGIPIAIGRYSVLRI
jgi:hypothetical protein